jgi:hypothetical protein
LQEGDADETYARGENEMKFAIVGMAYSHPYSYARILLREGHSISYAWDDDPVDRKSVV